MNKNQCEPMQENYNKRNIHRMNMLLIYHLPLSTQPMPIVASLEILTSRPMGQVISSLVISYLIKLYLLYLDHRVFEAIQYGSGT